MPSQDIYSMTPGSAVAQELQSILLRRKEEERQAMLDRLAREEHDSNLNFRKHQMESADKSEARLTRATDAEIAASQERIYQDKVKGLRRGTTPDEIQDEKLRNEIRNRGGFAAIPVWENMPEEGQEGFPNQRMQEQFAGTPEEQDREELRARLAEVANSVDDPTAKQGIGIIGAGGPAIPALFEGMTPPGKLYDPNSNRFIDMPAGTRNVDVLPWKPNPSAGSLDKPWTVTDLQGKVLGTVSLSPYEFEAWTKANPDKRLAGSGYTQPNNQSKVTTGDVTNLMRAFAGYSDAKQKHDAAFFKGGEREVLAQQKALYDTALGAIAFKEGTDPKLLDAATFLISDPELADMPIDTALAEIVNEDDTPVKFTDEERREINRLLLLLPRPTQPTR